MEETYFRDQVAVVTGAGGTLCSEIAADLASRGARVVLNGRETACRGGPYSVCGRTLHDLSGGCDG